MFFAFNVRRLGGIALFVITIVPAVFILGVFLRKNPAVSGVFEVSFEIQDRVLVIDAGHGGEDGGATSPTGLIESGVNLDIAKRLESLAGFFGIKTAMTRESETIKYPASAKTVRERKAFDQKSRIALINSFENAVLISIHQNKYTDPRSRGSQVFFSSTQGSLDFAEITQCRLAEALYPENRRLATRISDSIFIMKRALCPAILVECAFLSNAQETALLQTIAFKQKISMALLASYLEFERGEAAS